MKLTRERFNETLRQAIVAELTPSKRELIKPFIKKEFSYNADQITNASSLEGLLIWLLEGAVKSQRQAFLEWFDINSIKVCDQCGKFITEGYIVEDWLYFCSDECLHKRYTQSQYDALYENDDAYWTEWYTPTNHNWAFV